MRAKKLHCRWKLKLQYFWTSWNCQCYKIYKFSEKVFESPIFFCTFSPCNASRWLIVSHCSVVTQGGIARGTAHQLWKGSEICKLLQHWRWSRKPRISIKSTDHEELRAENLLGTFSMLHFRLQTRLIPLYFVCHGHQTQWNWVFYWGKHLETMWKRCRIHIPDIPCLFPHRIHRLQAFVTASVKINEGLPDRHGVCSFLAQELQPGGPAMSWTRSSATKFTDYKLY